MKVKTPNNSNMILTRQLHQYQVIIPESIALANERGLDEAILLLLGLEKKCRVNNDFSNLKEVCLHMIRLCRSKADWTKLNSTLAVINKR